eukprot:GHVR01178874.1.p1 GENE.GHVR01178874.1~~GHVR01178874.1.p1  ORF type:complete len:108 (+),score=31.12 GHVR01178874.1:26-325(+)
MAAPDLDNYEPTKVDASVILAELAKKEEEMRLKKLQDNKLLEAVPIKDEDVQALCVHFNMTKPQSELLLRQCGGNLYDALETRVAAFPELDEAIRTARC